MATYVIGDVQGCYKAFLKILSKIKFNPKKDKMIFCGDLVNRGGRSLEVLKWCYKNRKSCKVVLGNHDLSLLAQYYVPKIRKKSNKEFNAIFAYKKCEKLMAWLLDQKLIIHLKKFDTVIVHAGIYPKWSLKRAKKEAKFTLRLLKENPSKFLKNMFGAFPNHWLKSQKDMARARFAINSFTRMRCL
jgi:bis(5'-nucleosyl)-tetraphosphatase (symmetrical)